MSSRGVMPASAQVRLSVRPRSSPCRRVEMYQATPSPRGWRVTAGAPAAKAGIKVGDVIVSIAGKPTPTSTDLSSVLAGLKPGQTVQVAIVHQDGSKATVSLTLGDYPG